MENRQLDFDLYDEPIVEKVRSEVALPKFPTTRFQGSKRKILGELATALEGIECNSILDMFSGSGIVTLMFRYIGKRVTSNDFMLYNQNTAELFQKFSPNEITLLQAKSDLEVLLHEAEIGEDSKIAQTYTGVYFTDEENLQIDRFCQNIHHYDEFSKKLYIYAVGQALTKKRPYNLFHRANLDMRLKDVKRSFGNKKTWETPIIDHAIKCIRELKSFPVKTQLETSVLGLNSADLDLFTDVYDVIYLDPPYINSKGTAVDYSDFYHFLDGLCDYQLYNKADTYYPHKPIAKKYSAWLRQDTATNELEAICKKWPNSTIFLSYRSDGVPSPTEAAEAMSVNGRAAEIHSAGEYKYALSRTDTNEELFIISKPAGR